MPIHRYKDAPRVVAVMSRVANTSLQQFLDTLSELVVTHPSALPGKQPELCPPSWQRSPALKHNHNICARLLQCSQAVEQYLPLVNQPSRFPEGPERADATAALDLLQDIVAQLTQVLYQVCTPWVATLLDSVEESMSRLISEGGDSVERAALFWKGTCQEILLHQLGPLAPTTAFADALQVGLANSLAYRFVRQLLLVRSADGTQHI